MQSHESRTTYWKTNHKREGAPNQATRNYNKQHIAKLELLEVSYRGGWDVPDLTVLRWQRGGIPGGTPWSQDPPTKRLVVAENGRVPRLLQGMQQV